jgi:methyltransferase (TIGR00027 family)
MQEGRFSWTALSVAAHRAAHQILEDGAVFKDPFARAILGPDGDAILAERSGPTSAPLRLFVAARARFAEDSLARAIARGVRQAVVVGAGLDTLALRSPHPELQVFEVDHPATQAFKRHCLERAGLSIPSCLTFAPVDFERESLGDGLAKAGLDRTRPAFFIWLGVVPYLTRAAVLSSLDIMAALPASEVVFDYSEPLENYPPEARPRVEQMAARAAQTGEPWLSYFSPREISELLMLRGFGEIEDLGPSDIAARYFGRTGEPNRAGAHVLRARKLR